MSVPHSPVSLSPKLVVLPVATLGIALALMLLTSWGACAEAPVTEAQDGAVTETLAAVEEPPDASADVAVSQVDDAGVPPYEPPVPPPLTTEQWEEVTGRGPYPREPPPEPSQPFRPLDPAIAEGLGTLAWVLVVGLLAGGIAYLFYARRRRPDLGTSRRDYSAADELLSASADDLATGLASNLDGGDYREAIRMRFGQVLQALRDRGLLTWVPGRTNAEYEVALPATLRYEFAGLSAEFSFATYAGRVVEERRYRAFAAAADEFLALAYVDARRGPSPTPPPPEAGARSAVASSIGLLALATFTSCGEEWDRNLNPEDDGPHGVSMLESLLRVRFPAATFEPLGAGFGESPTWGSAEALPEDVAAGDVYVAIGPGLAYDSLEVARLSAYVAAGGRALLASRELSIGMSRAIYRDSCLGRHYRLYGPLGLDVGDTLLTNRGEGYAFSPVTAFLDAGESESVTKLVAYSHCAAGLNVLVEIGRSVPGSDSLIRGLGATGRPHGVSRAGDEEAPGGGPADDALANDEVTAGDEATGAAGSVERVRKPVFVEVPYGEGHFLVLSAPILLANAYLADTSNRALVESLVAYLGPEVTRITFDAPRRSSAWSVARDNAPPGAGDGPAVKREPLLREVFKRPALAAAWYLLIAGVAAFVLFGAKRLQRIVPVIQPPRNTTVAYLGNVSRLYLARPDNRLMAGKQLALFEAFCVRKFGLRPVGDAGDRERLAGLRGVDSALVESLARYQFTVANGKAIGNDAFLRLVHILRALYGQLGRRSAVV